MNHGYAAAWTILSFIRIWFGEDNLDVLRATTIPASVVFVHLGPERAHVDIWEKKRTVNIRIPRYLTDTCSSFVVKVYTEPLTAALNSNRAILSYADIHIVLSPVTQILELNRYTHTNIYMLLSCLRPSEWTWHDRCVCVFVAECFR